MPDGSNSFIMKVVTGGPGHTRGFGSPCTLLAWSTGAGLLS